MKKLMTLFLLINLSAHATYYNSVFDLKNLGAVGQNNHVGAFKAGGIFGGGDFKWIRGTNTGVTEFMGYIIKPARGTEGYWIREGVNEIAPEMFGADHTGRYLTQDGITNGNALVYWPGLHVDVATWTWDQLGLQMGMYYMRVSGDVTGTITPTTFSMSGNGFYSDYYIKGTVKLQLPYITSSNNSKRLTYSFRNITIRTLNTPSVSIFSDTSQLNYSFNENVLNTRVFYFDNVNVYNNIDNSGVNGGNGIMIDGSYNSVIQNCKTFKMDTGIIARFCQKITIRDCDMIFPKYLGYFVGATTATLPGSSGYGCCNAAKMYDNKVKFGGDANCIGILADGNSEMIIQGGVLEGTGAVGECGIYLDALTHGSEHVKTFKILSVHVEIGVNGITGKSMEDVFKFKSNGCHIEINDMNYQGVIDSGYITALAGWGGSNYVYVKHVTNLQAGPTDYWKLCNQNGTNTWWTFGEGAVAKASTNFSWLNAQYWRNNGWNTVPGFAPSVSINGNAAYSVISTTLNSTYRVWEYRLN
jgi:hypothetical protein